MRFRLIDAAKEEFPIHRICDVSASAQAAISPGGAARPAAASEKI